MTDLGHGLTATRSVQPDGSFHVEISADRGGLVLHWAVGDWALPPKDAWPPGTRQVGDKAVETPLDAPLHISFPESTSPSKLVFVLREGDEWLHFGASHGQIQLKPTGLRDIVERVVEIEATSEHWSLFNRLILANEVLDEADAAGEEGMAFMLAWLRLSTLRQLDWYRNSNYQSKDIAHVQKTIAERIADKARSSRSPWCRLFARMCLAGLPRGGGNGDDIRMGILQVMRENGIREGHRPGIEDRFLEQWHQKLHQNTTPEDVYICEAYLAFLRSGNMDDFWRVLWDHGGISRDDLRSMTHAIVNDPLHLPHIAPAMEHYLWILKTTHSGADLDVTFQMARGHLGNELAWAVQDILSNREAWWVPGKIVQIRKGLAGIWRSPGSSRDVMLLDIALDGYFRLRIERTDLGSLSGDDLMALVALVLENAEVAAECEDFTRCLAAWRRVADAKDWSRGWALVALATSEHTSLCLQAYMDRISGLVQPHADAFAQRCGLDPKYILNFGEEVVRGQPVFMLSALLHHLDQILRRTAGMGAWQVASSAVARGELAAMTSLVDIQGKVLARPQVIVAERLMGNEDIPEGVTGILTSSPTDVLSHVAIRARAQGVLLASCSDPEALREIATAAGSWVEAKVTPSGDVAIGEVDAEDSEPPASPRPSAPRLELARPRVRRTAGVTYFLEESKFADGLVGGKAANLAILRPKLPEGVGAPVSRALPFGSFEQVLSEGINSEVAAEVAGLQKKLDSARGLEGIPTELAAIRGTVLSRLQAPPALADEATGALRALGVGGLEGSWPEVWGAIRAVWASKWSDRAWLSRRAHAIPDASLFMGVLLQDVVPADYAFVLHTADPVTGDRETLHGELVVGMGETLVGNYPGRALSFRQTPEGLDLLSLPSKRLGLFAAAGGDVIARSDSNGEDLEAFAGAGLYDSVPARGLNERALDYASEPLIWDPAARLELLERLAKLGRDVERAFGGHPQDVEGVVRGGQLYVTQSRAQVLRESA